MRICYFGDFDPDYARNRVIIRGLSLNGVEVLKCHTTKKGMKRFLDLWRKHHLFKNKFDVAFVGYSDSRWMVPFARLIGYRKIVWDAFYSLYDTYVFDRKLVKAHSLKAKYYWFMDWLNCKLADRILLDTYEHIEYFMKTFGIPKDKFIRVLIGADDSVFKP